MPTIRQQKLAKAIIGNAKAKQPKNKKELLVSVGYAINTAEVKAKEILEQKGVKEALEDYGFTETNAKRVVANILLNENTDPNARLKASDMVFKVHGSYAPEKAINLNVDLNDEKIEKANQAISKYLSK